MDWPIQLDILDFIFKGLLIGMIASAPMGPVGILCVHRTLNKGRWYGFATGIGATISDVFYALLAAFGMGFIMDFIEDPTYNFILQIVGSVVLLGFGVYCVISNPTKNMHKSGNKRGTLLHNGVTGFAVTVSNPLIIFLFIAALAQFALIQPKRLFETIVGFCCIPIGALLWWYGLTWLIDKARGKFDDNGILIINKIIGSVVILFSVIMLFGTVFNLYHLPTIFE